MELMHIWMSVAFLAWLFGVASFLIYANYKGWLEFSVFSPLSKPQLYYLLRFSRTFTILFVAISVIAFLYFETDSFRKKDSWAGIDNDVLHIEIEITPAHYERELRGKIQAIEDKLKYAKGDELKILEDEKSDMDAELTDVGAAYANHIKVLGAHIVSLRRLYGQVPTDLLDKARKTMGAGRLIEADILLENIERAYSLEINAAGRVAWVRGYLARHQGDYQAGYEHFSRAARLMSNDPGLDIQAGYMAFKMGAYKTAVLHYESALTSYIRQYGENHSLVAEGYRSLGSLAVKMKNHQKTYQYYEKALLIDLKVYQDDHLRIAEDRVNMGWALNRLGEYRKAIPYLEQALVSFLKNYDKNDAEVIGVYDLLGDAWEELENYRESATYYEGALSAALKNYGEDHIKVAKYCDQLGWSRFKLDDHGNAIAYYERALAIYRKHYLEDYPRIIEIRNNLRILQNAKRIYIRKQS